ncbi:RBBP9/YdeN family alpha/beta hydrolase [Herbiconiux sp. YIM B11900]|uniref:RBBP9/YdeN family alpha/beta hydrolase n=1 Tax=Herbiconiux sp. YIM B11900 TaxID=3404131 RepID=UPI003F85AEE9
MTDVTDVTDVTHDVRAGTGPVPPARRVVIVHGFNASPEAHWFPWLRDQLNSEGLDVSIVSLPRSHAPDRAGWESAVAAELGTPDAQTWVVTHSLGSVTTLRVLAALPGTWTLGGLVVVAGFTGRLGTIPELDDYLEAEVDAKRVAASIRNRVVIRSDDDAVVPASATDSLARRLGATTVVVPGAGHFVSTGGVTELPQARDAVLG